jgi:hypothetical protein
VIEAPEIASVDRPNAHVKEIHSLVWAPAVFLTREIISARSLGSLIIKKAFKSSSAFFVLDRKRWLCALLVRRFIHGSPVPE